MKKSRYVVKVKSINGDMNILYNIRNGKGIKYPQEMDIWSAGQHVQSYLERNHFLTESYDQEVEEVGQEYQEYRNRQALHLIIMPHENCNFRCTYCYEKFERNKMKKEIEDGLLSFVQKELTNNNYKIFTVSWFGGEPLLGVDVMNRLSKKFIETCKDHNIDYFAGITTNGYLLTKEVFKQLIDMNVRNYQITIDGVKEIHDRQRIKRNGEGTYDQIINNIKGMTKTDEEFNVLLRMNVSPENIMYIDRHLTELQTLFGADERIELYFHNVGKWGGSSDDQFEICEENQMIKLLRKATDQFGMRTLDGKMLIGPHRACYAANPKSFVVGTDGTLYKCTVALYDEFNKVGQLLPNGEIQLNQHLLKLWTESGMNDSTCRRCFLSPSCHGDSCPLIRIKENRRPCPDWKSKVPEVVQLMETQDHPFAEVKVGVKT